MARPIESNSQWKLIKSFCNNTSIPACSYLTKNSKVERIFWISIIISSLLCTILLTEHIIQEWSSESVFITLDVSSRQLTKVDFPGVAICNINKISRHRALAFAKYLSHLEKKRNETDMLDLIRVLGSLYDFNIYGAENFAILQEILDTHDNLSIKQDLSARLLALGTPCQEILLNCSWNSVSYNCSELFQTRLTDSGFCCLFNYIRPISKAYLYPKNQMSKNARKFPGMGITKGLTVTVSNNITDYFYTDLATRGFLVKIFSSGDFPDLTSGSLKQIIVRERSEAFVKVEANTLRSQESIRALPMNLRKCKFSDEDTTALGMYTSSNCYVTCKMQSMLALCDCVPFVWPVENGLFEKDISACTMIDIPCLNKFQDKWLRYYPLDTISADLALEIEDSLYCENCLPNCNDVTYAIDTNYVEYHNYDPVYENSSRIHIFSTQAYTNFFKRMPTVTWYEALSTFGGIVSLLFGVSIVNLVEIGILVIKSIFFYLRKHVLC